MAKLFEEVLTGQSLSPSADLLVEFVGQSHSDCGAPGSSPVTHAAQSPPRVGSSNAGGPGSGSPTATANRRSPNRHGGTASGSSPARCHSSERSVLAKTPSHVAPLRVHTLVLQTFPTLLQTLMESRCKSSSERGHGSAGSGISSADATSDAEGRHQGIEMPKTEHTSGSDEVCVFEPTTCSSECAAEGQAHPETLASSALAAPSSVDGDNVPEAVRQQAAETNSAAHNPSSDFGSPLQRPFGSPPERFMEVTVDDEPDVFLEMIRYVYLNTCHVDQSNVKALMQIADKYGVEDIVRYCLQWMQEHFAVNLFYHFFTFTFKNAHFAKMLRQSLLYSLRSRRHFAMVTGLEGNDAEVNAKWQTLPVSFVEELLCGDDVPVVSEAEVLHLLARWAQGAISRLRPEDSQASLASSPRGNVSQREPSPTPVSSPSSGVRETTVAAMLDALGGEEAADTAEARAREDMTRLLKTFRKSDMAVKMADLEPILQIWQLNTLFSTKAPRDRSALDPGFIIYRGVAAVKSAHASLGELTQPTVAEEPWKGFSSVTMNSRDFLQQQEGFRPSCAPDGGSVTFPRLWVKIRCSSWTHREKRGTKSSNPRHSAMVGDVLSSQGHDTFTVMPPVTEAPGQGRTWSSYSQDDGDIGRKLGTSTPPGRAPSMIGGPPVPNLTDTEKIDHKVVCAVISGHMRHGIRIGQRERCSIYDIEDLYGQHDEVSLGGTATELEFELQLTVKAANHCGICQCALAVLPAGADEAQLDELVQIQFEASAEEQLRFYISSSHFDSNSCYCVLLNWVLRSGLRQ
eukprot:TRINITY_DN8431_c0_g1_i1.p1 TRINITY_DN8431_c0_g1~~TRINITY_DN8431_c0_g1_i1.p1  ORF type:complete len:799 (-),score=142.36 TRINITY_DN8431_c0_g1_i1:117-2513(-)